MNQRKLLATKKNNLYEDCYFYLIETSNTTWQVECGLLDSDGFSKSLFYCSLTNEYGPLSVSSVEENLWVDHLQQSLDFAITSLKEIRGIG